MTETVGKSLNTISAAKVVYILFLAEFFIGPIGGLIGVVLAYVCRQDAPDGLVSHYRFQIRTFWIGWLYIVIAFTAIVSSIGFVLSDAFGLMGLMIAAGSAGWIFGVIWTIVRCIKGLIYELRGEAYPNPGTWLF